MKKLLITEDKYKMSKWSGGNTREMAIYPGKADYLDRDFIWRLSSADSELEESSFTKLPDYDRILMVLEGDVVLTYGGERSVSLKAGQQDAFDGAVKTKCFGKLKKDYNLIYRKGSKARMEMIEALSEAVSVELMPCALAGADGKSEICRSLGVYAADGYVVVNINGSQEMVRTDQQLILNCGQGETPEISLMGEGHCILTEVIYENTVGGFEVAETVPGESSGGNFAIAMKLFLSNNKWSALMRREKKTGYFYSPELEKKLNTLDKFYITALVWVAGILLSLFGYTLGMSPTGVFILIAAYTVVDFLLISPLIYMAVLPKPLSAHVKDSGKLTPAEREMFEKQAGYDAHRERLMYKYRERGENEKVKLRDFLGKPKE